MDFNAFELNENLIEAISYMGFKEATAIQEQAIPEIMGGRDLIATAQTGTGKTASFVLPILNQITEEQLPGICSLVIVPTRELAVQIDQQIQAFSYFTPATSIAVYGGGDGDDWDRQKKALTSGVEIVIATPGKLQSHLRMGYADFSNLKHLVLDEADRMLDMGFYEDILKIISYLPEKRQNLMFSATMPPEMRKLARAILNDPYEINIKMSKPAEGVLQAVYLCYDQQKFDLLRQLINNKPEYKSILIFSSTKRKVKDIVKALKGNGYKVEGISSDFEQSEREDVLLRFRSREIRVLVATDVLSRGIDIQGINLIFNFDVPGNAEDYVHRIGRTARADTTGVAITFVNPDDMYKFARIEQLIEREVPKIPLPPALGEGPKWKARGGGRSNRRSYGKKGQYRGKSGSGKRRNR